MKMTPWVTGSLCVALIAACNGNRRDNDTGAAGAGNESGSMQGGAAGTGTDTGMTMRDTTAPSGAAGAVGTDTAQGTGKVGASGSAKSNQTKSGVTNTKTGKSTLGPGATKTSPDQGQPVTAKGDTLQTARDSTSQR
jgi:hypothetical protein